MFDRSDITPGPYRAWVTERATRSVYTVFILAGVSIASLLSRVPQIRDLLHLKPGALGALLLMTAIGSLLSLPSSGLVVHRLGAARTVSIMSAVSMAGLAIVAIGTEVGAVLVGAGLFVFGFGAGQWDVAMNVEGSAVEQQLDRAIMSRFHAAFSIGTLAGALIGAGMNAVHVRPMFHLVTVAALVALGAQVAVRGFLPAEVDEHADRGDERSPLKAWTERRTVLIGLFVLCMTFAEGTGNDWLGVAAIDGYGASAALGSLAYVLFVASMTAGRWFAHACSIPSAACWCCGPARCARWQACWWWSSVRRSRPHDRHHPVGVGRRARLPDGYERRRRRTAVRRWSRQHRRHSWLRRIPGRPVVDRFDRQRDGRVARPDRDRRPVGARVRSRRFDTSARGRTGRRRAEMT